MKLDLRPSEDSPGFVFSLRPWQVTRTLLGIVLVMSVLSLAGLLLVHVLAEPLGISLGDRGNPSSLYSLAYLFNADDEFSPANWYSSIALFGAAVALAVVGLIKRRGGLAYAGHWIGLAIIFGVLSMGETTVLNDRLVRPSQALFNPTSGFLAFGWVIPAMILLAIFGLSYLRFFFDLPGRTRWLFLLAAVLYVGGALGLEMVGSQTAEVAGLGSFPYELLAFFEETLEMLGVIVLIHAVLTYLESPFLTDDAHLRLAGQGITISRRGWVVLALLVVFAVLLGGAATRNMRPDEEITLEGTSGTLLTTIAYQAQDVHAPLYFVGFHLWRGIFGDGELTSRYFALLQSLLTAALVFHLGRRWFGGWRYGLAALLALGLSSYFFRYGVEIRPYATVMLAAAGSMLAFSRWLEQPTWRRAAWYGLSVALMLYLHYFGLFLMLAQGLVLLGRLLAGARQGRALIGQAAGAYLGAFLLWLPWFPTFLRQVQHVGRLVPEDQTRIAGLGMAGTTFATNGETLARFLSLAFNALPWLGIPLLILGGLRLWRRRAYWLAVAWGVGVPVLMFLVNLIVPVYEPRYATPLVPGLGLLLGVSVLALFPRRPALSLGGLLVVGLLTVGSAPVPGVPVRDHMRALEAAFQPGDIVLTRGLPDTGIAEYHFTHYAPTAAAAIYAEDGGTPGTYLQPWEGTDADLPRCVWFGTSNWYNPDVQARFATLEAGRPQLMTAGAPEGYLFQRLCLPPEEPPRVFGGDEDGADALRFLGADRIRQATDALEVALWWEVDAPPAEELVFGVYLLDANGMLVAQKDGPLVDYWSGAEVPLTALEPGRYHIDRRLIPLPPDLPPGDYTLALAIYRPADGTRLPVENAPDDLLRVLRVPRP